MEKNLKTINRYFFTKHFLNIKNLTKTQFYTRKIPVSQPAFCLQSQLQESGLKDPYFKPKHSNLKYTLKAYIKEGSWLISRPFAPFQASLARIWQHNLLLKMRFSLLKLQFLLQKWIQDLQLPLGHPDYANTL